MEHGPQRLVCAKTQFQPIGCLPAHCGGTASCWTVMAGATIQ
ncbi:hypothetical protein [Lysobacter gummosus]